MRSAPHTRRPARRLGAAVAAVTVGFSLTAPAVGAEPTGLSHNGRVHGSAVTADFLGWNGVYDNGSASGAQLVTLEDATKAVRAYCVEAGVEFPSGALLAEPYSSAAGRGTAANPTDVDELPRGAWLAANHRTVPAAMADDNDEFAAVQAAIWAIVNGRPTTEIAAASSDIRDRADVLVAAATLVPTTSLPAAAPHAFVLDVAASDAVAADVAPGQDPADYAVLTVSLLTGTTDAPGPGVPGERVQLSTTGDADLDPLTAGVQSTMTLFTQADGTFRLPVARGAANSPIAATTTELVAPAGTLLQPQTQVGTPPEPGQLVITAEPSPIVRTAATVVPGAGSEPPPTTPPTTPPATVPGDPEQPPAEQPPTTNPDGTPTELPFTGGVVTLPLLLGAAGTGVAGLLLLLRRRTNP